MMTTFACGIVLGVMVKAGCFHCACALWYFLLMVATGRTSVFNNITGTLPETLGKLTTLKLLLLGPPALVPTDNTPGLSGEHSSLHIRIERALCTGTLPNSIVEMINLECVAVFGCTALLGLNSISGTVPQLSSSTRAFVVCFNVY